MTTKTAHEVDDVLEVLEMRVPVAATPLVRTPAVVLTTSTKTIALFAVEGPHLVNVTAVAAVETIVTESASGVVAVVAVLLIVTVIAEIVTTGGKTVIVTVTLAATVTVVVTASVMVAAVTGVTTMLVATAIATRNGTATTVPRVVGHLVASPATKKTTPTDAVRPRTMALGVTTSPPSAGEQLALTVSRVFCSLILIESCLVDSIAAVEAPAMMKKKMTSEEVVQPRM